MEKKIKVAIIGHASSERIRGHLKLRSLKPLNLIKTICGISRKTKYTDISPWNNLMISYLKDSPYLELHAIYVIPGIVGGVQTFFDEGVYYHCVDKEIALPLLKSYFKYKGSLLNSFTRTRKRILSLIDTIQPDLINLIGAENPFYSLVGLDIDTGRYPLIVTMQTALSDPDFPSNYPIDMVSYRQRCEIEQQVLKNATYIATDASWYREVASRYYDGGKYVRFHICTETQVHFNKKPIKQYDFVYSAYNIEKAGDDALSAFALACEQIPSLTLLLVGGYTQDYYNRANKFIKSHNLEGRVTFTGFCQSHTDALQEVLKAKFALIPIKIDLISSTILEAMTMEIPIVTFKTKGTPFLNRDFQTVLLSDIGDYQGMANNMVELYSNYLLSQELVTNAKKYLSTYRDNKKNMEVLEETYKSVYNNFYENKPLPEKISESIF